MESKPDTIKISVTHKEEISATYADLHVTVKGSSLVSGNEAMKKAKEVNGLVEALTSFGVKNEAITLQGVHLESESGMLLKSSSVMYRLKIRCEDLNQFAGMLDVIAAQKNATLDRVEWKYSEDDARNKMLKVAIEKAKTKANQVARSLNVKLLGVYDLIENSYDEETPPIFPPQSAMMVKARATSEQPSLRMDIQHTKTIHVNLEIWYRISAF